MDFKLNGLRKVLRFSGTKQFHELLSQKATSYLIINSKSTTHQIHKMKQDLLKTRPTRKSTDLALLHGGKAFDNDKRFMIGNNISKDKSKSKPFTSVVTYHRYFSTILSQTY